MVAMTKRRFASVTLLSIILPISLLTTFRLVGIVPEPPIPQIIAVDAVSWNMSRPNVDYSRIDALVTNSFDDSSDSVNFDIAICNYYDDHPYIGDYLDFRMFLKANITEGFIDSVIIRFSKIDSQAYLNIIEDPDPPWIVLENLSITALRDSWITNEPYIEAISLNRSRQAILSLCVFWRFSDRNNVDHEVTITSETSFFNGTTYQKVVIPINIGVLAR